MKVRDTDTSRHLRQRDILDRDERKLMRERGLKTVPRWRNTLGDTPTMSPGDREGAQDFYFKIMAALKQGGWTKDERNKLNILRRKWQRRTQGQDPWFERYGQPFHVHGQVTVE